MTNESVMKMAQNVKKLKQQAAKRHQAHLVCVALIAGLKRGGK